MPRKNGVYLCMEVVGRLLEFFLRFTAYVEAIYIFVFVMFFVLPSNENGVVTFMLQV